VKLFHPSIAALAAVVLIGAYGCGNSAQSTNAGPNLDSSAPAAPAGLSLVSIPEYNEITWTASASADVANYQVYEYLPDPSRDNSYVMIGESASPSFRLEWSDEASERFYRVRAVDQAGNRSGFSNEFNAHVPALTSGGGGATDDGLGKRTEE
jgi:hypothetical protein